MCAQESIDTQHRGWYVIYRDRESLTEQWKLYSPAESEQFDNSWQHRIEKTVEDSLNDVIS